MYEEDFTENEPSKKKFVITRGMLILAVLILIVIVVVIVTAIAPVASVSITAVSAFSVVFVRGDHGHDDTKDVDVLLFKRIDGRGDFGFVGDMLGADDKESIDIGSDEISIGNDKDRRRIQKNVVVFFSQFVDEFSHLRRT